MMRFLRSFESLKNSENVILRRVSMLYRGQRRGITTIQGRDIPLTGPRAALSHVLGMRGSEGGTGRMVAPKRS